MNNSQNIRMAQDVSGSNRPTTTAKTIDKKVEPQQTISSQFKSLYNEYRPSNDNLVNGGGIAIAGAIILFLIWRMIA